MYTCTDRTARHFVEKLRQARTVCSNHCLYFATTWAAELLYGCRPDLLSAYRDTSTATADKTITDYERAQRALTYSEKLLLQRAKLSFDRRDFSSVADMLTKNTAEHPTLWFLKLYALYMLGEKIRLGSSRDILGADENDRAGNPFFDDIKTEMFAGQSTKWRATEGIDHLTAFTLYLYGIMLKRENYQDRALEVFFKSLHAFPYNWSVWLELRHFVQSRHMFLDLKMRLDQEFSQDNCACLMKNLFLAEMCTHIPFDDEDSGRPLFVEIMKHLTPYFPNSGFILALWAKYFYIQKHYQEAIDVFEELRAKHPTRLEDLDIFSNMLFSKKEIDKLCQLDIACSRVNAFHPVSLVIKGNYCSATKLDYDAIAWYKKALRVQRDYAQAWILLGHVYLDNRVVPGAVECYRRALTIEPYDYRAWHGLGEAYRINEKSNFSEAIYCFRQALGLSFNETQTWHCLHACYRGHDSLDDDDDDESDSSSNSGLGYHKMVILAQYCLQKAEELEAQEHNADTGKQTARITLAQLFWDIGKEERAIDFFTKVWNEWNDILAVKTAEKEEEGNAVNAVPEQFGHVAMLLAQYAVQQDDHAEAKRFAISALNAEHPYNEEARSFLDSFGWTDKP